MRELDRALNDIATMREHLARSSEFQGFGPLSVAATGLLAMAVATTQGTWLKEPAQNAAYFIWEWIATAAVCITLIGIETVVRSRRVHGSMAVSFLQSATQHFCPTLVAGALMTAVVMGSSPQFAWALPGLWQILFSLGAFATAQILPRPMYVVGVWYLICGLTCLRYGPSETLGGWSMGIPFGFGQLLVAAIIAFQHKKPNIDK